MMVFNASEFSEIIRTLSPGRFCRFINAVLDRDHNLPYRPRRHRDSFGVSKSEYECPDFRFSLISYADNWNWGGGMATAHSDAVLAHHVPSLVTDMKYLDILRHDMEVLVGFV